MSFEGIPAYLVAMSLPIWLVVEETMYRIVGDALTTDEGPIQLDFASQEARVQSQRLR